jgi:hypothetical protein
MISLQQRAAEGHPGLTRRHLRRFQAFSMRRVDCISWDLRRPLFPPLSRLLRSVQNVKQNVLFFVKKSKIICLAS